MTTHGGSRNRSGPAAQMHSARSDARNLAATQLPIAGYDGDFPPLSELLPDATEREGLVWAQAWVSPQAAQWIREPYRHRTIAMWVRWSVRAEDPEASAATITAAQRLADQIGLTPAGLKENGWLITPADPTDQPATPSTGTKRAPAARTNGGGKRMKAVRGRRD